MKKICVLTANRAEYGLLYPVISKIEEDPELELQLVVSGTHLSKKFGYTKTEIEQDGFPIAKELDILEEDNDACAVSKSMARAVSGFAEFLKLNRPDMAIILGDRYEMMAFAIPLVNEKIPIAHINGGETTEGALDEIYRHCLTKMSTLHFTNCEVHRNRVIQMGENPNRVFDVGDVCVDNILNESILPKEELERDLKIELPEGKTVVVTYHPVTMEEDSVNQVDKILKALDKFPNLTLIFTKANVDSGGIKINERLDSFVKKRENAILVDSLGRKRFLSLLKYSVMMIGNSSSGIYEAPVFQIPTINIGNRQKGRIHGETVIDCPAETIEVWSAIVQALSDEFQQMCRRCGNLFGDGHASEKIIKIVKQFLNNGVFTEKKFYDLG